MKCAVSAIYMDVLPPELWGEVHAYVIGMARTARVAMPAGAAALLPLLGLIESEVLPAKLVKQLSFYLGPEHVPNVRAPNARVIGLSETQHVQDFGNEVVERVKRIARLGGLVELELIGAGQEHIDALGCVSHSISLIYIRVSALTNLEAVRHVPAVYLSACPALTDIRALGSQKDIRLYDCPGIVDVSSLAGVGRLQFIKCGGITSISGLGAQKKLIIHKCYISDFSEVARVPYLDIAGSGVTELFDAENDTLLLSCNELTDISRLRSVKHLDILDCPNVARGLPSLANVTNTLIIAGLDDANILRVLRAPTIYLHNSAVKDISRLGYASDVNLYDCPNVADVSPLRRARKVCLERCASVRDVAPLCDVRELRLNNIRADYASLGRQYRLDIRFSKYEEMPVVGYRNVRHCYDVRLLGCPEVIDELRNDHARATESPARMRHLYTLK